MKKDMEKMVITCVTWQGSVEATARRKRKLGLGIHVTACTDHLADYALIKGLIMH